MATKQKKLSPEVLADGVRGFSHVLRESIMDYYKGTCVQSFGSLSQYNIERSGIRLESDSTRRTFNYEREEHNRRQPIAYYLAGAKMFELRRDAHEAVFAPTVMRRSPELSTAYDQVLEFFNKFLQGVTIVEREDNISREQADGSNDRDYVYRDLSDQIAQTQNEDEETPYDEDFQ